MTKQYVDQIIQEAIQESLLGKVASGVIKTAKYGKTGSKAVKTAAKTAFVVGRRAAGSASGVATKDLIKKSSSKVADKLKSFLKTRKDVKAAKSASKPKVHRKTTPEAWKTRDKMRKMKNMTSDWKFEVQRRAADAKEAAKAKRAPKVYKGNTSSAKANAKLGKIMKKRVDDARDDILTKSRNKGFNPKTKTGNPIATADKRKNRHWVDAYKKSKGQ
jgi:hypothetical protein